MLPLFIHWNVDPVIFYLGSFGLRWYSLGFLLTFTCGYFILLWMYKKEHVESKYVDAVLLYVFLGVLIGARLGHCLFYEPDYFCTSEHWLEIFLPFNLKTGQFTGYQGLASHGAAIAVVFAMWLIYKKYRLNLWWVLDRLVIAVALGGFFIRMGNLFNSEIYGVETTLPWGFIFERNGEVLPKHPTQLYEAFSYLVLGFILLWIYKVHLDRLKRGELFAIFMMALFGIRFMIEFIKEPQVGFEEQMVLNMGQILSIPCILFGLIVLIWSLKQACPAASDNLLAQQKKSEKRKTLKA